MTGTGPLTLRAVSPGHAAVTPNWGPEQHSSTTWHRPGAEWGTGWTFPSPGCWTVKATRGRSGDGEVSFKVA
ncbi:hypothetical protein [Streptomyces sp. NPDC059009]|uniref:hypothetical protein n=1 Tax=Streptomyces sp. NPDC059009 TaxID=3346694 RepID=UPI00369FAAC7